ncbi:hypothetical protein [Ferrovibrio sp.]|uniref:hypothetical protein n=1 Tax=Ferrovibrio sp. TaxID=1917215 RepID=UPI0035B1C0D9
MINPAAKRAAAAAARNRRRRARAKAGMVVLAVEVEEFALADALIETGRLSETECRKELARAISKLIADWESSVTRNAVDPVACVIDGSKGVL